MSADDVEHVVCVIDRGEHGAIRVARKTFNGAPFTDVRFFYKTETGELRPTAKGTSIRDSELHTVLDALAKIARKVEGQRPPRALPGPAPTPTAPPTVTRTSHRQAQLPGTEAPKPSHATRADHDLEPDAEGLF